MIKYWMHDVEEKLESFLLNDYDTNMPLVHSSNPGSDPGPQQSNVSLHTYAAQTLTAKAIGASGRSFGLCWSTNRRMLSA